MYFPELLYLEMFMDVMEKKVKPSKNGLVRLEQSWETMEGIHTLQTNMYIQTSEFFFV